MLPENKYVSLRNGAYYVAGTRIGLDVLVHDFRSGKSPKAIFAAYPAIGSMAKVYGAIAFLLDHPDEVETYLLQQDERWNAFKAENPLPQSLKEAFESAQKPA